MAAFNAEDYRKAITSILQNADRSAIGAKGVRKQLQAQFPDVDMKTNKDEIDALTTQVFTDMANADADSESSEDEKPLAKSKPKPKLPSFQKIKQQSPDGAPDSSPNFPLATGNGDDDGEYARRLQDAYNKPDRASRNGGASTSKSKKTKSKKRVADSDDSLVDSDSDAPKGKKAKKPKDPKHGKASYRRSHNAGFQKLFLLSDEMARVTGHQVLSRSGCTKYIWKYIKANDLQLASKRTEIVCDSVLQGIIPLKQVNSFTMAKYISPHLLEYDDDDHGDLVRDYSDAE